MNLQERPAFGDRCETTSHPIHSKELAVIPGTVKEPTVVMRSRTCGGLLLWFGIGFLSMLLGSAAAQEGGQKLYTFYGNSEGGTPEGLLTLSGNTLYGTAYGGGNNGYGTVFKINTDGSGFTVLYAFGGTNDGSNPSADMILIGDTLYGTTTGWTAPGNIYGSVFSVRTNGTGFTVLHTFTNGPDGATPYGGLVLSGATLYGMANGGGTNAGGTVFKVDTNGTGFRVIYSLGSFGYYPYGGLVVSGSTLYGELANGGAGGVGTVFKVSTNGTGFTTLHSFSSGDGWGPFGTLTLDGDTLYGTTYYGGCAGHGVVFKIGTNGKNFTTLYCFSGDGDGLNPQGVLTLSEGTLYGVTQETSTNGGGGGNVFSLSTNGSDFTVVYTFNCNQQTDYYDGGDPAGGVVVSGSTLYGTTESGGSASLDGIIYSLFPCRTITLAPAATYMNFDSVNTSAGRVDPTSYLASFGVTLTNVNPPGSVFIANSNIDGCGTASSSPNWISQYVGGSSLVSYALDFSNPLQSVTFTRCAVGGGCASPIWTVTAYAGTNAMDSAGVCCLDSDTGKPAQTYTLNGPGITSLTISANGEDFSAYSSPQLDDFYFYPTLNNPVFGVAYSQTLTASGGGGPCTFGLTSGSLPNGMALSSDGVISGTPTASGAFNFTVTVTDFYGCTGSSNYSFVIACPTIQVNPATLPNGTLGVAYSNSVSASGGASPYIFSVSAGSLPPGLSLASSNGLISGTPTTSGAYNFTIEAIDADNCVGSNSYSEFICTPPAQYSVTGGGAYCSGGSGVAVGLSGSQPGYDYHLFYEGFVDLEAVAGTGLPISFGNQSAAGTYAVIAYSTSTPCSAAMSGSATVTVNSLPTPTAGNNGPICSGTPLSLTASGGVGYSWSGPNGYVSSAQNPTVSASAMTDMAGMYTVTVTNASGCTAQASTTVMLNPTPVITTDTTNQTVCAGSMVTWTVTASGTGLSYQWQASGTNLPEGQGNFTDTTGPVLTNSDIQVTDTQDTNSPPQGYDCVITSGSGCVIHSTVASLTVNPLPTVSVNSTSACAGSLATLTATTGASNPSYLWSDNETTASITVSPAITTTYTVTVTDGTTGCQNTGGGTVTVNPNPVVGITSLPDATYGSAYSQTVTNSGAAAVSATGLPAGLSIDNSGVISGTPTITGSFNVMVTATSATSCSTSVSINLTVDKATPALTLLSSENPTGYRNGVFFTATNLPLDATSNVVFQANGVAFSTNDVINGGAASLSITNLPRGTTNIIAADYSGDNNYQPATASLTQTVTNHPPEAATMTVQRAAGFPLTIAVSDIATNWSDVDGDTVILAGLDFVTTNNVVLTANSTDIFYSNGPNVNDQFSYAIADGFGGTNVGLVDIEIVPDGTSTIVSVVSGANQTILTGNGIPGYSYVLQRATNLVSPVWVNVSTNTVATNGVINTMDTFSDLGGLRPPQAYYRITWSP